MSRAANRIAAAGETAPGPVTVSRGGLEMMVQHPQGRPARGVLVSVHGLTRQYRAHFERAWRIASALDLTLAVPCFTERDFPDYQRLGRTTRGPRADLALLDAVDGLQSGAGGLPLILLGFSGGAQFAHRFALAHPARVAGVVLMAPGWYTFPDPGTRYPYGLRTGHSLTGVRFDLPAFLRLPLLTIVGAEDVRQDSSVRTGPRLDARQGMTRLARARSWHAELHRCAQQLGITHHHDLMVVPGIGHDFAQLAAASLERSTRFAATCISPPADTEAP